MHSDHEVARVPLIGAPNSGKTTLYNWLTGSRFRAVNYPGSTVDYFIGESHARYGDKVRLVDTPGTYSLSPKSPEEKVTYDLLYQNDGFANKKVVVVVDATQMARQLYLVEQAKQAGFRIIVALTMMDLFRKSGRSVDLQLLSEELGAPILPIDGTLGGGVKELLEEIRERNLKDAKIQRLEIWDGEKRDTILKKLERVAEKVIHLSQANKKPGYFSTTMKLDSWLLNPVWGPVFFLGAMFFLFSAIFWLSAPLMDAVDAVFGTLVSKVAQGDSPSLGAQFLGQGLFTSMGAVLVFVPQIFILFFGIGALEDSGYLARASTLIDKPLTKLGMNGRSFVPLLSGFACAVPALLATRTMRSPRERWITAFVIPLMTCSARLPVYALLLSILFYRQAPWKPGLALAGIYILSALVGGVAAWVLNRYLPTEGKSLLALELPIYRRPRFRVLLKNSWQRTKSYLRRAGPTIFTLSVVIWLGTTFPHYQESNSSLRLQESYLGQAGKIIEPAFVPMGLDWRVGVGLLSAFAAREVFVSTLAILFIGAQGEEASLRESLLAPMREATNTLGQPLFTVASLCGLIVFFMIALQCLSTTSVAWREMRSWKFALAQLVVFNGAAYLAAVLVVQILS